MFVLNPQFLRFTMENYDDFVDVDSNNVHSTNEEDEIYSVSNGYQSSDDGDDVDNDDDDDSVKVDAYVGDR
ncbi:hypothetical protein KIW84_066377 [Lathyrus oleraceus]|uniref:Uncharacterized protein n=1 Tax=Pisum sativum TaxID=3888 RepID=A0A9D5AB39_PEA|nr:hypothetical protein KIW84_066377 [Pisum sativum]